MINDIITAIPIILIMFGFSFFIFKNAIKRINDSAKRYFLEKLQEYNYLIDEQEEKLEQIKKEVNEQRKKIANSGELEEEENSIFSSEIENKLEEMRRYKAKQQQKQTEEIIYDIPTPQYREEPFFDNYKKIKKNFNVDNEKVIKEFLESNKGKTEERKYQTIKKFRNQFSDKTIYECLTLENEEQYTLVKEVIDKKVSELIEFDKKFNNPKRFTVTELINILEEKMKEYNPNIYVYVGQDNLNYDYISKRIKTKFYKNMSEGVIIYYKGKIYDYSI